MIVTMETITPPTTRPDVAGLAEIETLGEGTLALDAETLPWIDQAQTIDTRIVGSQFGEFQFGNMIGASNKLRKVADTEMRGGKNDDDRLNRVMYESILSIMSGNPGAVKRFRNSPKGIDIYYGGLPSGARVYFVDIGTDDKDRRTFLKAAVCGSKNSEPKILSTFSGKKEKAF